MTQISPGAHGVECASKFDKGMSHTLSPCEPHVQDFVSNELFDGVIPGIIGRFEAGSGRCLGSNDDPRHVCTSIVARRADRPALSEDQIP